MIPYKIKIDLEGQRDITSNVTLSVGDANGYGLVLEFYRNGKLYDITGYNLSVSALPAGATIPIPDVGTVESGRGYYLIKPSMYAYAGKTRIEIILSDGSSSTVTKVLHFSVRSGFSSQGGSIVDEKDFTVLQKLIQQAQTAISQAEVVLGSADAAKAAAEEARASAQKVKDDIQNYGSIVNGAYVSGDTLYITTSDGKTFTAGNVRGGKGDTGNGGVHIGTEEPEDPEIKVWIDPTGHDGMREIVNILSRLKYKDGGIEVDVSGLASYVTTAGTAPAYTATIEGITELKKGVVARIIPHASYYGHAVATLNVNSLGAKEILAYHSQIEEGLKLYSEWNLTDGVPLELVYDGGGWVAMSIGIPSAEVISGVLAVSNGGTGNTIGRAPSAAKLATSRTILTNLESESGASFDGTGNAEPGVKGVLPVAHGGHGGATVAQAQVNLGLSYVTTAGTGEAYTATIPGITELKKGVVARIIPHTVSTTNQPTLNVNSLGAKTIVRKRSYGTNGLSWLSKDDALNGLPVEVVYNGSYWVLTGQSEPMGEDISGPVPVAKGGTGVASLDALAAAMHTGKIATGTYAGTGASGSAGINSISLSFKPKLVIVQKCPVDSDDDVERAVFINGFTYATMERLMSSSNTVHWLTVTWSDTGVRWYHYDNSRYQLNQQDHTYHYVAIG